MATPPPPPPPPHRIYELRTAGKISASNVIASGALRAAKQSRVRGVDPGLLRRQEAPRNDGLKELISTLVLSNPTPRSGGSAGVTPRGGAERIAGCRRS